MQTQICLPFAQAVQINGMVAGIWLAEQTRHPCRQRHHRHHINLVVVKNAHQFAGVAAAQIVVVQAGDEPAGHVVLAAAQTKQTAFQRAEGAGAEPVPPQAPGGMQQIQVGAVAQVGGHAVHDEAAFKQGDVEGTAVKGHQSRFFRQQLIQQQQQRWLIAVIAQKVLAHHKALAVRAWLKKAHAHHEGERACARQPRRFGIQEEKIAEIVGGQSRILHKRSGGGGAKLKEVYQPVITVLVIQAVNVV